MSKTYSKCTDCGRMDYIGGGTVCIACEREKVQQAIRDSICPTYAVCEKCSRRFAVGNVPTNVCGDCDENHRLRTALAAAERERDSAKAEVERLRSQTSKNSQVSVVRFEGTGNSCEAVLSLCGGPNPTKCVWKSCTYEGGYLVTPNGATEFVKGDWLLRDESDFLHVLTDPFGYADRKSGKMRDLVVAWLAAEISEGRVCEVSGLDRDLVRIIRDHLIARGKRAASVSEDNALTPAPPQAKENNDVL